MAPNSGGFKTPAMRQNSPRRKMQGGFNSPQGSQAPMLMPQIAQSPMVPQKMQGGEGRLLPPMISQAPGLAPQPIPPPAKSTAFDSTDQGPITPPQMNPMRASLMTALNGGNFQPMNSEGPAPLLHRNQGGEDYSGMRNMGSMRRGMGRLGLPQLM
jgi:hypothetical protein